MSEFAFSPASERNKYPILEQLRTLIPPRAKVLEIGSGLGQHAVFFLEALPGLDWQATEQASTLPDLQNRLQQSDYRGLRSPLQLDVLRDSWPPSQFDVVYTANTTHIMPWAGVEAMMAGAGSCLVPGGCLVIYGPFNLDGAFTSPGNRAFDADLRRQDPSMGLREVAAIDKLASKHHMQQESRIDMPANNMLLVYRRT